MWIVLIATETPAGEGTPALTISVKEGVTVFQRVGSGIKGQNKKAARSRLLLKKLVG